MKNMYLVGLGVLLSMSTACAAETDHPAPADSRGYAPGPNPNPGSRIGMANPASVYCASLGYAAEDETCTFPDGTSCEQWSFFRGECGEGHSTREGLSAASGPSDFVASNLSNAGMWVTIYNTFGRIVASGCVEPNKMVIFGGLLPVLPHEVRLELTTFGNCQGQVFRQLWLTVSIGAFGNGWLDSKYEWHGSLIPPIPSRASATAEDDETAR
ncbi:MAG: DUF333 domain-containing protein [Labilithrix sp.]|nr:DUF333 domain-containing protein [Labilithrix sp.]